MHDKLKLLLDKIGLEEEFYPYFNNGKVDKYMCLFKQHLFKLSLKLCGAIYLFSSSLYDELVYIVEKILNRAFGDERLYTLFDSLKGIYSFTEL